MIGTLAERHIRTFVDSDGVIWRDVGKYVLGGKHLEKQLVTVASVLSLGAGFFFTSPNITGRAIGGVNILDSSIIGAAFFILGLVGLLLCIKNPGIRSISCLE